MKFLKFFIQKLSLTYIFDDFLTNFWWYFEPKSSKIMNFQLSVGFQSAKLIAEFKNWLKVCTKSLNYHLKTSLNWTVNRSTFQPFIPNLNQKHIRPSNFASVAIICCSFSHIFARFKIFAFHTRKVVLCFNCKSLADCATKKKAFSTCIIKCNFFSFCLVRDLRSAGWHERISGRESWVICDVNRSERDLLADDFCDC